MKKIFNKKIAFSFLGLCCGATMLFFFQNASSYRGNICVVTSDGSPLGETMAVADTLANCKAQHSARAEALHKGFCARVYAGLEYPILGWSDLSNTYRLYYNNQIVANPLNKTCDQFKEVKPVKGNGFCQIFGRGYSATVAYPYLAAEALNSIDYTTGVDCRNKAEERSRLMAQEMCRARKKGAPNDPLLEVEITTVPWAGDIEKADIVKRYRCAQVN